MMRAQLLYSFGDDAKFTAVELPDPAPGTGQVLIRVVATSINPIECKLRRYGGEVAPELPALLGSDLAGSIVGIGSGVDRFAVGDQVFGYAGGVRGNAGAYAQMAAVDARMVAAAPRSIPLAHAAALPLSGLTAAEALERSHVASGKSVLILGATGGVGHLAVQMANALGASVHAGVRSQDRLEAALAFGANTAFAIDQESPDEYAKRVTHGTGFDALLDCTAGIDLGALFGALRDGGNLVSLVTRRACDLSLMSRKGLSLHTIFVPNSLLNGFELEAYTARLERIAELVDEGWIKPQIDRRTFTLDQMGDAHSAFESGQADGKILIMCEG